MTYLSNTLRKKNFRKEERVEAKKLEEELEEEFKELIYVPFCWYASIYNALIAVCY